MTTGERIKTARVNKGITQQALANKIGASYQQISQYERNVRNPKLETILKIADALGIPMTDLVEVNYGDPEDETFVEWAKRLPPPEELPFDLKIFKESLIFAGYDFQKISGKYYMIGDGGFVVTEEEIRQLEKQTNDFLKFQCQQLEEKHTPDFLKKKDSDKDPEGAPPADK